jgi:hypothetical protein
VQALVGRLDVHAVEQVRLDAELAHLVGDPLRDSGGGDPRVGDHEHPAHAVLAQVEPDLVGRPGAELQLRRAVGEHRLRVGRERGSHGPVLRES